MVLIDQERNQTVPGGKKKKKEKKWHQADHLDAHYDPRNNNS